MSGAKKEGAPLAPTQSTNYPDPEVTPSNTRRIFSAEEKLRILAEVEAMQEPGEIGAYLRREGIYSSYLCRWRKETRPTNPSVVCKYNKTDPSRPGRKDGRGTELTNHINATPGHRTKGTQIHSLKPCVG